MLLLLLFWQRGLMVDCRVFERLLGWQWQRKGMSKTFGNHRPSFSSHSSSSSLEVETAWNQITKRLGVDNVTMSDLYWDRCGSSSLTLEYSLFRSGHSSLKLLNSTQQSWITHFPKPVASLLLLLHGHADAAHEVILGVNLTNLATAERVARLSPSERQAYNWMGQHPLSREDHWIHALIHQYEGNAVGEGDYTGWENAEYWMAGGPHQWNSSLEEHPVAQRLREYFQQQSQSQLGQNLSHTNTASSSTRYIRQQVRQELQHRLIMVVPQQQQQQQQQQEWLLVRQHRIIAGGGQHRIVPVPPNTWDALAWIALLKEEKEGEPPSSVTNNNKNDEFNEYLLRRRQSIRASLMRELQHLELLWLMDYCLVSNDSEKLTR